MMTSRLTLTKPGESFSPSHCATNCGCRPAIPLRWKVLGDEITLRPARGHAQLRKKHGIWVYRSGEPLSQTDVRQDRPKCPPGTRESNPRQALMKFFFDTSVLLPCFLEDHEHHEASLRAFLEADKKEGCCGAHSLAELYATATRLTRKAPFERRLIFARPCRGSASAASIMFALIGTSVDPALCRHERARQVVHQ